MAAAEAAAALLDLAMEESQAPVDQLGDALERISRALAGCMRVAERQLSTTNEAQAGANGTCREQLRRDLAVCIENLQFHDRLIQQLTHARDCLAVLRRTPVPDGSHALAENWNKRHASEGSIELF